MSIRNEPTRRAVTFTKTIAYSASIVLGLFHVAGLVGQDLPDVAQGLQPYVAYQGGQLDQVSTLNDGLTVRIPLVSYPQKGELSLSYSVIFNSFGFRDLAQCTTAAPGPYSTIPLNSGCTNRIMLMPTGVFGSFPLGPRLIADQMLVAGGSSEPEYNQPSQPPIEGRFYVIGADNAEHPLASTATGYQSVDESGYFFVPSTPPSVANNNLGTNEGLYSGDTTKIMSPAPGKITDSSGLVYTSTAITDPDGNSIAIPNSTGGALFSGLPATDTSNRSIPLPTLDSSTAGCPTLAAQYQSLTSAYTWSVPGSNGTVTYLFCYAGVNIYTHFVIGSTSNGNSEFSRTVNMLQSIVLPNKTYWGFIYDSNNPSSSPTPTSTNLDVGLGQLISLIYPTGGSTNYTYTTDTGMCNSQRPSGTNPDGVAILAYPTEVMTRTMKDSQGNVLGVWTYQGPQGSILSPANDLTVPQFVVDPNPLLSCSYYDAGVKTYQGPSTSGPLLQSTSKTYTYGNIGGQPVVSAPRVAQISTTLANGRTSTVNTTYDPGITFYSMVCDMNGANCRNVDPVTSSIGGPISTTYLDYGGATLRQDKINYQWETNSAYLASNFLDIPAKKTVFDGTGAFKSQTTYGYDESGFSPGGARGHLTTTVATLATGSTSPTVHVGWNGSGQRIFTLDADANAGVTGHKNQNGHTIDYSYNSAMCNGSVLTDTYDALSHHTSGSYDCTTGLIVSLTDANNKTTTIGWDSMRRLASITYPTIASGTPITSFVYTDSQNTATRTIAGNPAAQTLTIKFDAFGREAHSIISDVGTSDTVDKTYDSDGRIRSVSNPYQATSDTTYGVTTYTYDALNRKILQTQPDQAHYSGASMGLQVTAAFRQSVPKITVEWQLLHGWTMSTRQADTGSTKTMLSDAWLLQWNRRRQVLLRYRPTTITTR